MMGLVVLGSSVPRFHFFFVAFVVYCCRRQAMPAGDGGRPMVDAHGERALLDLCDANGLRLSSPSRARSAPGARAAYRHIP